MDLKFFAGEELNYLGLSNNGISNLIDKMESDPYFMEFDSFFFFDSMKEEEIKNDYPILSNLIEEADGLQMFIEWEYQKGEDLVFESGLIIEEEFLCSLVEAQAEQDETHTDFWIDPKKTISDVKKSCEEYAIAFKVGQLLGEIQGEGYSLDEKLIEDAKDSY